jgi:hypothetical protein
MDKSKMMKSQRGEMMWESTMQSSRAAADDDDDEDLNSVAVGDDDLDDDVKESVHKNTASGRQRRSTHHKALKQMDYVKMGSMADTEELTSEFKGENLQGFGGLNVLQSLIRKLPVLDLMRSIEKPGMQILRRKCLLC